MSKFLKFFTKQQQRDLVNDLFGYKEYVAVLTQTGTSAPVATVLNSKAPNYLGDVTITRNNAGLYTVTKTGAFTINKTVATVQVKVSDVNASFSFGGVNINPAYSDFFEFSTGTIDYDGGFNSGGQAEMSYFDPIFLTIKVYN